MKKMASTLGYVGALASALLLGSKQDFSKPTEDEEKRAQVVRAGTSEYNQGPLISHGFLSCSGIVFDYGNEAIMGHVLKGKSVRFSNSTGLGSDEAIKEIINKSNLRGLDYRKAKITIDAGAESALEDILEDLKDLGLKPHTVKKNRMKDNSNREMTSTTIYYDPSRDFIYSRPTKDGDFTVNDITDVY